MDRLMMPLGSRAARLLRAALFAGYVVFGAGLAAVLTAADSVAGFTAMAAGSAVAALVGCAAGPVRPRAGLFALASGAVVTLLGLAAHGAVIA
jgi:hypothetical protein